MSTARKLHIFAEKVKNVLDIIRIFDIMYLVVSTHGFTKYGGCQMKHRRFFPEYSDLLAYVTQHKVKNWRYQFTFAYGYELIVEVVGCLN